MNTKNLLAGSVLLAALLVAPLTPATAQVIEINPWGHHWVHHVSGSRIHERLNDLEARVNSDESSGTISSWRARELRHRIGNLRAEEVRLRDLHDGLTADDVARLNVRIDDLDNNIATAEEP
jgi:hypothetical protein